MTLQLVPPNNENSIARIFFDIEARELRSVVNKYAVLEIKFEQNKPSIFNDIQYYADFRRDFEQCCLACREMEMLVQDPRMKRLGKNVRVLLENLHAKLPVVSTPFVEPKVALLKIAKKFKQHMSQEAMEDFFLFATKFPKFAQQVYNKLWWFKGSPATLGYGHSAFHNQNGCYSLDSEKAEAIKLLYSLPIHWLNKIKDLFQNKDDQAAILELKEFSAIYPKVADLFFNMLWKMNDMEGVAVSSHATYDPFGLLEFYSQHFDLNSEPCKKVLALEWTLIEMEKQMENPAFFSGQNKIRRELSCSSVIKEHIDILKAGCYFNRFGKNCGIQMNLMNSIMHTEIYKDGGPYHPKTPPFEATLFEMRERSCASIAYELALDESNSVCVMNLAHSHVPGGNYLSSIGSQEEELFRCTGLPLALDKSHKLQEKALYPIHHHDTCGETGCIYTPHVPIIRLGYDRNYQLAEQPATISVCTFAVFQNSPLGYVNDLCIPEDISEHTKERIRSYLRSAYDNKNDILIIGSLSCEAYSTPLGPVAELMMEVINEEYLGCFKKIVFTVLRDGMEGHKNDLEGDFYQFTEIVKAQGITALEIDGEKKSFI